MGLFCYLATERFNCFVEVLNIVLLDTLKEVNDKLGEIVFENVGLVGIKAKLETKLVNCLHSRDIL